MPSLADAAVAYAEAGLFIFPCRRDDKRPALKGYRQLRWTVAEVAAHWTHHPEDNIGIDGEANGLVFVDVDNYKSTASAEDAGVFQPVIDRRRPDQISGRGGEHYIFRVTPGAEYISSPCSWIDVKHRGYILLAPSVVEGAPYHSDSAWWWSGWDKLPLAPDALVRSDAVAARPGSIADALARDRREEQAHRRDDGMIKALRASPNPEHLPRESWLKVGMAMRDAYHGTAHNDEAREAWLDWSADWDGAGDDDVDRLVDEATKVWPADRSEARRLVSMGRSRGQSVGFNAFKEALLEAGIPQSDFARMTGGRVEKPAPKLDTPPSKPSPKIPMPGPRRWLIEGKLWRGKVTVVSGPGGVGKSSYVLGMAVDAALGRKATLRDRVHGKLKVLAWNGEDDVDESARKVHALLMAHKLGVKDLEERLWLADTSTMRLDALHYLQSTEELTKVQQRRLDELTAQLEEISPDIIIIDPLVSMHGADENSNSAMEGVMDVLREGLAQRYNCAVLVVHHTKKMPSDMDKLDPADMARGASAINAAARAHFMVRVLTESEAKVERIDEVDRRSYITIVDAKNNLSRLRPSGNTFHLSSVELCNGSDEYPAGDYVGAVKIYASPDQYSSYEMALTIVKAMTNDLERRWFARATQSTKWVGHYMREIVDSKLTGDDNDRNETIKALINYMVDHGLIQSKYEPDEKRGRVVPGYALAPDAELKVLKMATKKEESSLVQS